MQILIKSLPGNDRGPRHMESVLRAVHAVLGHTDSVTLGYRGSRDSISLFASFPDKFKSEILEYLQDAFPDCKLKRLQQEHEPIRNPKNTTDIQLVGDFLPLRTFAEFESTFEKEIPDPAVGLLAAIRTVGNAPTKSEFFVRLRPASKKRLNEADRAAAIMGRVFPTRSLRNAYIRWRTSQSVLLRLTARFMERFTVDDIRQPHESKVMQPTFECHLLIHSTGAAGAETASLLRRVLGALSTFATSDMSFKVSKRGSRRRRKRGALFNTSEVAHLFHPPRSSIQVAKLETEGFRELEPPANLPAKEEDRTVTMLGRVRFRGQRRQFGIRTDDLRRHVFLCGRTGTGKTTLIRSMALDSINAGRNVVVIDPHGDLVEGILDCIPRHRTNDVVYFNAADRDYPIAFNPLHCPRTDDRPLVADSLVSAFKKLYGDSWGPRLEQLLRNSILALLEHSDSTLLSIRRLLTSKSYRSGIVASVDDPVVRSFWIDTFDKWNDRFQTEAVSPVINKLDAFLANSIARNITCQSKSTIDVRRIIDNPRSIFLCNLSKGLVGEQTSTLLGAFLVAQLQNAALSRADVPEAERTDVQVYIDEFHSFVSDGNNSFATILSESRKYRVAFAALATQFLDQIDESTLSAVLGNCGSTVVFRSGVRDSETLAAHLGGVEPDDIVNLPNFTAYAKLLINGEPTRKPFSMTTQPWISEWKGRANVVRDVSRRKYGRPRVSVESKLAQSI